MTLSADQLNEALAVGGNHINKEMPILFTQAHPLYDLLLKRKEKVTGGDKIQMGIVDAKVQSTGFITGTASDTLNTNKNRNITHGELDWKYYYSALTLELDELNKCQDSKEAVINLISTKIEALEETVIDDLCTMFYESGTAKNKQFNGMADIFAASGTAYAGITDTDVTNWLTSIDSSTTAINYSNIQTKMTYLKSIGKRNKLDWMISNSAVLSKFKDNEQLKQRFYDSSKLDAGFEVYNVDGVKWYADEYCQGSGSGTADNHLYLLNSKTLKLFYKYGFGTKCPLDKIDIRTPNQPIETRINFMSGNIGCTNRRLNGVFKTLNPAA